MSSLWVARRFLQPVSRGGTQSKDGSTHTCSVGALVRLGGIGRCSWLDSFSHVGIRAGNVLAGKTRETWQVVIEAIQPHGTVVGGQTPFSNNHWTKGSFHIGNSTLLAACIRVKSNARIGIAPSLINVCIQRTFGTPGQVEEEEMC